jgi:hypothetical protein
VRIGVMLHHFEQHEGGVKVYTKSLLPRLLAMAPQHQWVLIYPRRNLLGTFAAYRNVEEVTIRVPGTICWDQLAVPWVANRKRLDLIQSQVHGAPTRADPKDLRAARLGVVRDP